MKTTCIRLTKVQALLLFYALVYTVNRSQEERMEVKIGETEERGRRIANGFLSI